MTCQHAPRFSLNTVFARKPHYICRKCGAELEMSTMTHSLNRSMNAILVGALFFKVLGNTTGAGVKGMLIDFGVMLSFVAVYVVAYYFLLRFGKFTEKITPVVTAEQIDPAPAAPVDLNTQADQAEKEQLSQEQLDLMKLYDSYAQKSDANTAAAQTAPASEPVMRDATAHQHTDACVHAPVKSWKIYIPTYMNFTCVKCGQPITFSAATKKSLNIAIMGVVLLILMPNFLNNDVSPLEYLGLTILSFALAGIIQALYLHKGKFDKHNPESRKRW